VTQLWYVGHNIADVYKVAEHCWLTCTDTSVTVTSEDVGTLRESTGYIFLYLQRYVFWRRSLIPSLLQAV